MCAVTREEPDGSSRPAEQSQYHPSWEAWHFDVKTRRKAPRPTPPATQRQLAGRWHRGAGRWQQRPRRAPSRNQASDAGTAFGGRRRTLIQQRKPLERRSNMGKGNDNDRWVVPNKDRGGWDVVKEDHERASAPAETRRTPWTQVARSSAMPAEASYASRTSTESSSTATRSSRGASRRGGIPGRTRTLRRGPAVMQGSG